MLCIILFIYCEQDFTHYFVKKLAEFKEFNKQMELLELFLETEKFVLRM